MAGSADVRPPRRELGGGRQAELVICDQPIDLRHTALRPQRLALSGLFGLVGCAIIFRFGFARQRRVMTWMDLKIDG